MLRATSRSRAGRSRLARRRDVCRSTRHTCASCQDAQVPVMAHRPRAPSRMQLGVNCRLDDVTSVSGRDTEGVCLRCRDSVGDGSRLQPSTNDGFSLDSSTPRMWTTSKNFCVRHRTRTAKSICRQRRSSARRSRRDFLVLEHYNSLDGDGRGRPLGAKSRAIRDAVLDLIGRVRRDDGAAGLLPARLARRRAEDRERWIPASADAGVEDAPRESRCRGRSSRTARDGCASPHS